MKHYTKTALQLAIAQVNKRYSKGLNDDDQVATMVKADKNTIGFSFLCKYDSYELCTDLEKLEYYVNKNGYWSEEVKYFNERLKEKNGYLYMEKLNNEVKAKSRQTAQNKNASTDIPAHR